MKKTFLFVVVLWIITGLSLFSVSAKAPIAELPAYVQFDQTHILVYWGNVPDNFVGTIGWTFITDDAGYTSSFLTDLIWVTKIGNRGVWEGKTPIVPHSGNYSLTSGIITSNNGARPMGITNKPPPTWIWLYQTFIPIMR